MTNSVDSRTFEITDTTLYVLIVTLPNEKFGTIEISVHKNNQLE